MDVTPYKKPEYFRNRELSWISFDERVLNEARDKSIPLFERLKFISITSSNLDEFYMVRVASLKDQVHAGYAKTDIAGMSPKEQLKEISAQTHELVRSQYSTLNRSLLPALEKVGLHLVMEHEKLNEEQQAYVDRYFEDNVYPVLTPMAMDSSRPFPLIRNKTLNIGALISKKDKKKGKEVLVFATVQVPSVLPRVIVIPSAKKEDTTVILLEEIIERNIDKLFLGYDVVCAHPYRIMRNADLSIDEDGAEDLLVEIQKQLKKRQWGEVIRLEVEDKIDSRLLGILKKEFDIKEEDIFYINGPLDLTMLMKVYGQDGFDQYKEPKYTPAVVPAFADAGKDIFQVIREGDVFLHHPYMSFDPVVNFVRQAAKDPDVLAIKQTLYRVSGNSPIVAALAKAAENGKQVTALVELKARFDEENNIVWARRLERAGCHVIYGLVGLKTHSKITLIVRKEETGIKRYVHLGTGNYNDKTAKLYTDFGLLTANDEFGQDASAFFNVLSGYSEPPTFHKLIMARLGLRERMTELIDREIAHAKAGKEAYLIAKMNSLIDQPMIEKYYEASQAGVKVDLIVRGICGLRPGIKGLSENITVRSIIGRFLEHHRAYYFWNDGQEELYLSSADMMHRNLSERVELMFPVERHAHIERIKAFLDLCLKDNVGAHMELSNGNYRRVYAHGREKVSVQERMMAWSMAHAPKKKLPLSQRLKPVYHKES